MRPQQAFRSLAVLFTAYAAATICAQQTRSTPAQQSIIRIWGHGHRGEDYATTLLTAWETGFQRLHPDVYFENHLYGDNSAIGSLYTGAADLALLDRQASFIEADGYHQGTGYEPFAIPVARGDVGVSHHAPAILVYVNRANPLVRLSLAQLDGIFDADHRLGARSFKTWGELGLGGEWATRPIHIYMPDIAGDEVQFFERAAMKGSQKFSCCATVFRDSPGHSAEQQIASAIERDRFGIAIATLPNKSLRAVPLSAMDDAGAVLATEQTISNESYPLGRTMYLFANRRPKQPLVSNLAAFLTYVISPEGQAVIARAHGYLALSPRMIAHAEDLLR